MKRQWISGSQGKDDWIKIHIAPPGKRPPWRTEGIRVHEDRTTIEDVLARSTEDWVFDHDILAIIAKRTRSTDYETLRAMALGVILDSLTSGYLYPVFFVDHPWARDFAVRDAGECDIWEVIQRINLEWPRLQPDCPLDIVWFGPTNAGMQRGLTVLEHEGWSA